MSSVVPRKIHPRMKSERRATKYHASSLPGSQRDCNQDSVCTEESIGFFAVADGVGGYTGGAEASELICAVFACELMLTDTSEPFGLDKAELAFHNAVSITIDEMRELASICPALDRMGTTFVGGWIVHGTLYFAHAGDSRLYLVRNQQLTRLTKDHSLVQELCDSGTITESQTADHPWRNMITRYIGPKARAAEIDIASLSLEKNDRLIFATDGITDVLPDESIRLAAISSQTPDELCNWLQLAAEYADAHDDTSCVVVDIDFDSGGT